MKQPVTAEELQSPYFDYGLYAKERNAAKTLDELREVTARWRVIFWDADHLARNMTEEDFQDYVRLCAEDRAGSSEAAIEMGKRFYSLSIPYMGLIIGHSAVYFKVPYGLVLMRLMQIGWIKKRDGLLILAKEHGTFGLRLPEEM